MGQAPRAQVLCAAPRPPSESREPVLSRKAGSAPRLFKPFAIFAKCSGPRRDQVKLAAAVRARIAIGGVASPVGKRGEFWKDRVEYG